MTIGLKQFFRNIFYILLTLAATPYMILATFLSLFMDVPNVIISMEVCLPTYEVEQEEEQEEEEEESEELEPDSESESEHVQNSPVIAPISVENHDHDSNSGHCTPIPRHKNEVCPDSPLKRRATDIEDEIVIESTARILTEDFKNITSIGEVAATTVDLPTYDHPESPAIETSAPPPPSLDENDLDAIAILNSLKQEPSESFSLGENDE